MLYGKERRASQPEEKFSIRKGTEIIPVWGRKMTKLIIEVIIHTREELCKVIDSSASPEKRQRNNKVENREDPVPV